MSIDILNHDADRWVNAECWGRDPELWFSDNGPHMSLEAAKWCRQCVHQTACLDEAMELERGLGWSSRFGIWGGLGPRARARLDHTTTAISA